MRLNMVIISRMKMMSWLLPKFFFAQTFKEMFYPGTRHQTVFNVLCCTCQLTLEAIHTIVVYHNDLLPLINSTWIHLHPSHLTTQLAWPTWTLFSHPNLLISIFSLPFPVCCPGNLTPAITWQSVSPLPRIVSIYVDISHLNPPPLSFMKFSICQHS